MAYRATRTKPTAGSKPTNADVYERVIARIVAELEAGNVKAWVQPWSATGAGRPRSVSSGKNYRGINVLALGFAAMEKGYTSPFWATFKQWSDLGAQVRKGDKSTTAIFFKELHFENEKDGEVTTKRIPLARAFSLFNSAQVDNCPDKYLAKPQPQHDTEALPDAEAVIDQYLAHGGPSLRYVPGNSAHYEMARDEITLPEVSQFKSPAGWASVAMHECAHSTGHKDRLDREGITEHDGFGSHRYSVEECVAQLASAMVLGDLGIEDEDIQATDIAYIRGWAEVFKADPKILVTAASQASKAADMVLEPSRQLTKTVTAEPVADFELEVA